MVDSWYCLDWVILEGMSQVSRRSKVGNHKQRTLNTWLPSGTSAGTFVLSVPSPQGLTEIGAAEVKVIRKTNRKDVLYHIKKSVRKSILHVLNPRFCWFCSTLTLFLYLLEYFHGETKDLEGGVSLFGVGGGNWGGGGEIQLSNCRFKFLLQRCWGVILLPMSKIIPPNGSCAHDAVVIGVADQCRYFLLCLTMCPRSAPVANFAWFYNLFVLMYLFLQLLRLHDRTTLFRSMTEQLCWRQKLGPPLKNDPRMTSIGGWGHLMEQINPPFQTHRFSMSLFRGYGPTWSYRSVKKGSR